MWWTLNKKWILLRWWITPLGLCSWLNCWRICLQCMRTLNRYFPRKMTLLSLTKSMRSNSYMKTLGISPSTKLPLMTQMNHMGSSASTWKRHSSSWSSMSSIIASTQFLGRSTQSTTLGMFFFNSYQMPSLDCRITVFPETPVDYQCKLYQTLSNHSWQQEPKTQWSTTSNPLLKKTQFPSSIKTKAKWIRWFFLRRLWKGVG